MPTASSERRARRAALCGLALLCGACASTPPPPPSRPVCLAVLVHAYDVEGMVNRSQADTLGAAHRAIEGARSGYGEALTHLSPDERSRYEAATDRFVTAARATPDAGEAGAVWAQAYGTGLSDEEVCQIAQFARTPSGEELFANGGTLAGLSEDDLKMVSRFERTPAGPKQVGASHAAGVALGAWLSAQRSASLDQAAQRYLGELRVIMGY